MSRKTQLAGVAMFFLIILALIMSRPNLSNPDVSLSPEPNANSSAQPSKSKTAVVPKVTYETLLKQYEGRRIQFDKNCQAIPNQLTFKNGTSVMFDNRSGDARTFALNETVYQVGGHNWKIITLSSKTLPFKYLIDCGSAQNVGSITIQR